MNISAVRSLCQNVFVMPFIIKNPEMLAQLDKKNFLLMSISGFLLSISMTTNYRSFLYIPVADASVIFNSSPLIVLIASFLWLKEDIGKFDIINIIVTLLGVLFVCQPTFLFDTAPNTGHLSNSWIGYLCAMVTSIFAGLVMVLIRKVHGTATPGILIIQGLIVMAVSLPVNVFTTNVFDPSNGSEWLYLFGAAIVSSSARGFLTLALSYEKATIVAPLMTLEILFTLIFQITLYNIYPTAIGIVGTILVVCSVIAISVKSKILLFVHRIKEHFQTKSSELNEKKSLLSS